MSDVNGSRFHLVQGDDWPEILSADAAAADALEWDAERALLRLKAQVFRFPTAPGDQLPQLADRRGAGRDRHGHWYFLADDESEVLWRPASTPASEAARHFWSSADAEEAGASIDGTLAGGGEFGVKPGPAPAPQRYRGLAVTGNHYLVVGVVAPLPGLLVFDLHAGGAPLELPWPDEIDFVPFDVAPTADGGVVILDRPLDDTRAPRFWVLDRHLRVLTADQDSVETEPAGDGAFAPKGSPAPDEGAVTFPAGIPLETGSLPDAIEAVAVEALPDGSVLVLESEPLLDHSVIHRFRFGQPLGAPVELDQVLAGLVEEAAAAALRGHDLAFVAAPDSTSETLRGTLYLAAADGNQSFAFSLEATPDSFALTLALRYLPMRRFTGKGLVAAAGYAYYDLDERWIPLVEQPQRRFLTTGQLVTPAFDGREPGCVWHRLFFDARVPPGTAVEVESHAADQEELLVTVPWSREPAPYLRPAGAEVPYTRVFSERELENPGTGTWELLFQGAVGRYLELRLTFTGNRRSTPCVRALRAYYPRFSYLVSYLPAVYRQESLASSGTAAGHGALVSSFLERYLANVEGLFTTLEGRIAEAQLLFDVDTVDADYLDWLAGWFGVALDPAWDENRRRLFLRYAPQMFRERGTVPGLVRAIRLAIDPCPDDRLFTSAVDDPTSSRARGSVRILESFLERGRAAELDDAEPADVPRFLASGAAWTPARGAAPLHELFRDYLRRLYPTPTDLSEAWDEDYESFDQVTLPALLPEHERRAADWLAFTRRELGFTYAAVSSADAAAFRLFLRRRYRRVALLNLAWGLTGEAALSGFDAVVLPAVLPTSGQRLVDWIRFVTLALPIRRAAHRFTVLVPVEPGLDEATAQQRIDLVRRIVEREKPAHTRFEVRELSTLWQVGQARLGLDTEIDQGSRLLPLHLDAGYLGEGYLTPDHPWGEDDRTVVGRDAPVSGRTSADFVPKENA